VPDGFWLTEDMSAALATRHMGRVIYAYRTHPHHGRILSQQIVGGWLNLTQAHLSRLENGRAPEDLGKLIHYSRVLTIPAGLLWFDRPGETRLNLPLPHELASGDPVAVTCAVAREASAYEVPSRQQFLRAASVLGVAAVLPRQPADQASSSSGPSATDDPLADLREAITVAVEAPDGNELGSLTLDSLDTQVQECHSRYQRTDYAGAARLLPRVVRNVEMFVSDLPAGVDPRAMRRTQAAVYIAAAKLATKTGDHDLAWLAADRAQHAALAADAPSLAATARRQIACVFHDQGRLADAERVAMAALNALNRRPGDDDPRDLVSARGALMLLAAMTSVRRGERNEARHRLAGAAAQAQVLGRDDNRLWSGFGPTNVAIHALAAALALDEPREAVNVGARIDTRLLPQALTGRRARVHVDLASGHTRLGEDALATVHILEIARSAPQILQVDHAAQTVLTTLLGRARGSTVSVLRGVAEQAGVAS
jgi:hypothetical protein